MKPEDNNATQPRMMYHKQNGAFDLSRMIEQLIPSIIMGAVIVYANNLVIQSQVADLRTKAESVDKRVADQNDKLIALNSQVATYLALQTQMNSALDSRLTYMERDRQQPIKR